MAAKRGNADVGAELEHEIRQSERFQQREWRLERLGWALLALFVLAGLVGALGAGPLSSTTAESDGETIQVEYQRLAHHEADDGLIFRFSPDLIVDGKVTLELTGSWVSGVDVVSVRPAPSAEYAVAGGVAFDFDVLQRPEVEVAVTFRANGYGALDALATVGDDSVEFFQFVLP